MWPFSHLVPLFLGSAETKVWLWVHKVHRNSCAFCSSDDVTVTVRKNSGKKIGYDFPRIQHKQGELTSIP